METDRGAAGSRRTLKPAARIALVLGAVALVFGAVLVVELAVVDRAPTAGAELLAAPNPVLPPAIEGYALRPEPDLAAALEDEYRQRSIAVVHVEAASVPVDSSAASVLAASLDASARPESSEFRTGVLVGAAGGFGIDPDFRSEIHRDVVVYTTAGPDGRLYVWFFRDAFVQLFIPDPISGSALQIQRGILDAQLEAAAPSPALLRSGFGLGVIRFRAFPRIGFLSPHGLGIAVGYLVGGMLMARHAARRGISQDDVWAMLMRAVLGVIVGARLFYVAGHLGDYFGAGRSPLDILKVWEGGVVFYGGAVGGIVAAIPYMRSHGLPFRSVLDAAAPAFPLGLIFGRIGDIVVGDHLGGASTMPFAMRFAPYDIPADSSRWVAHAFESEGDRAACFLSGCHQTALYDLVNVIVLFGVAMWLARKPRAKGFLIAFVATWYGGARLLTDFARDAELYGIGPVELHGTQWFSIALILAGGAYLIRLARRGEREVWVTSEPTVAGVPAAPAGSAADAPSEHADDRADPTREPPV